MKPEVTIYYCPKCGWLPRATWLTQELLATFESMVSGIKVCPSDTAGDFKILVNEQMVFNRKTDGFPEPKEVKQRIRDMINPDFSLGHSDRKK